MVRLIRRHPGSGTSLGGRLQFPGLRLCQSLFLGFPGLHVYPRLIPVDPCFPGALVQFPGFRFCPSLFLGFPGLHVYPRLIPVGPRFPVGLVQFPGFRFCPSLFLGCLIDLRGCRHVPVFRLSLIPVVGLVRRHHEAGLITRWTSPVSWIAVVPKSVSRFPWPARLSKFDPSIWLSTTSHRIRYVTRVTSPVFWIAVTPLTVPGLPG